MALSYNGSIRISMWSSPRNVSTALMYSFAQRNDTHVVDEPYYGHYIHSSNPNHPGQDEIMAAMDCMGDRVTLKVILGSYKQPVVFFKNMTHHMVNLNLDFLQHTNNIFLTRDPKEMLPSLEKGLRRTPNLRDTGFRVQVQLLKYLKKLGQNPPVLESRELLLDPAGVLEKLCQQLDIPFDKAMLSWPPGPKPEDGVWAKYWYDSVHTSTAFNPYKRNTAPFPEHLRPLLDECRPYYDTLYSTAIKASEV